MNVLFPETWNFCSYPGLCKGEATGQKRGEKKNLSLSLYCLTSRVVRSKNKPTSTPAAWQWINLRCWSCNQRMHSPGFHSWKAVRYVNWAWRHWSHQWYLPKQDTNDRTSLQQISTFSGSKTDSGFDNKIELIYSKTVMDSTGGISPLLLW